MRKIFTLLVVSVLAVEAYATHLMGGEITATQLHDSTYMITLTTYRDTFGIPMDSVANFDVKDTSGNTVMTFSISYDTALSGGTLMLYPYGVEVYVFRDSIRLPGPGTFHISFTDCCRNGAIQNLSNPLGDNMYLTTTVTHYSSSNNSTPFFLIQPVIFLPVNTTWSYNPLPFDIDGDSLVWQLDTPLTAFNQNCGGYSTPPSATSGPFSLNSATGSINWTASQIGNFDATVLVEEYRNNVKIGEIRRDMQFIVVNPTSQMAYMSNMSSLPQDNNGNYHVQLTANSRYDFSFFAEDPDTGDVVSIMAYGEPFMFDQFKRASFFVSKTGKTFGNEVEGTFVWKPHSLQVRKKPYVVVYRVSDGTYATDYSVLYTVNGPNGNQPTGIEEISGKESFHLYPNPVTNNSMTLSIDVDLREETGIEIYDVNGMLRHQTKPRTYRAGEQVTLNELGLRPGAYIILMKSGINVTDHSRFIVVQ